MSMSKVSHVVVHYSASYADQNITADDIDRMHRERGWAGIGYHWFIRRDGTVEPGRPEHRVGAHVGGQNSGKIGICWAGGLDRVTGSNRGVDNRTPAQTEALITLIREVLKRHPGAQVVGHRDLAATQCPGFDAPRWWAQVGKKKMPEPVPVKPGAPALSGHIGEDRVHIVQSGETWFGIAREHGITLARLLTLNDAHESDVLLAGRRLVIRRDDAVPHSAPEPAQGFWAWLINLIFGRN